jgi:hypothetical protein
MGHMLKNTVFKTAGYALGVPVGSSSVGPANAVVGQTRFSLTSNKLEYYGNISGQTGANVWNAVAREGNVLPTITSFTGNAVQTQFWPIDGGTNYYKAGMESMVLVHVGTVYQIPGTNYTFNGTGNIVISPAPSNGAAITLIHGYATTISTLA